ncbi:MAG: hypothetical protein WC304_03425 [Candidatus Gracilibacteria bacterium]|jgi:hypothetical protein
MHECQGYLAPHLLIPSGSDPEFGDDIMDLHYNPPVDGISTGVGGLGVAAEDAGDDCIDLHHNPDVDALAQKCRELVSILEVLVLRQKHLPDSSDFAKHLVSEIRGAVAKH